MSNAIATVQRTQIQPLEFTQDQRQMIRTSFLNGASEAEAAVLLELARVRRLNPITKQIHFVKRWDSNKRCEVWSAQVGIDGFRAIAERTGLYDGQDEPMFEYEKDGRTIKLCRVKVYRKDWSRPMVGVAYFTEYAQKAKEGGWSKMWSEKPHVMISKCAEALALRKAFPEDFSGLYVPEEMGSSEEALEKDVTPPEQAPAKPSQPAPVATGSRVAQVKERLAARTARLSTVEGKVESRTEPAAPAQAKPDEADTAGPHPWVTIRKVLEYAGIEESRWASIYTGATGKKTRKAATEDDIARVQAAVAVMTMAGEEDIPA